MKSFVPLDGKRSLLNLLRDDLNGSTSTYYLALSHADSSGPGLNDQRKARNEMQVAKVISGHTFVVPNNEWESGRTYQAYDDNVIGQTDYYVINSLNEVFVCVQQSKTLEGVARTSTVEPTRARAVAYKNDTKSFTTSDGYIWRYLYTLDGLSANKFKNASFLPVQKVTSNSTISELNAQRTLQNAATEGEILSIAIDSGGTGFTFSPTIIIEGGNNDRSVTPSAASFTAVIDNGRIVRIVADSDGRNNISHGANYDFARAYVAGNDTPRLRPVISPKGGINADPVATLRADKYMIQTNINGDEDGTIPLASPVNDFKQVMLIRDPLGNKDDSALTSSALNAMDYFNITGSGTSFVADEKFRGGTSQATAKTYWHDTSNNRLYFVQNDSTGFGSFDVGETLTSLDGTGAQRTINTLGVPDFNRYSGDIIYINNLNERVVRSSLQNEDLRLVIDLGKDDE